MRRIEFGGVNRSRRADQNSADIGVSPDIVGECYIGPVGELADRYLWIGEVVGSDVFIGNSKAVDRIPIAVIALPVSSERFPTSSI